MRIERAVFFNGRYEGVYSLIRDNKLEWEYVSSTFDACNAQKNQDMIDAHIRLDIALERIQPDWKQDGKHYSILGNIDFRPEDLP